mmetsp:Transcript_40498/g.94739  ORF Transcript_40498/g.94739 Transcript_40498/m.94739 type:complete len:99 (+) Transcript_40498:450-746(+)
MPPLCEDMPVFTAEMERVMTLLAFDDMTSSPVADLLSASQRQKVASEVNTAILISHNKEHDSKLPLILKTLSWSQHQLGKKVLFPRMTNLSTQELQES